MKKARLNRGIQQILAIQKAKHLTDELASSPDVTRGVLEKIVKKIYRDYKHIIDIIEEKAKKLKL